MGAFRRKKSVFVRLTTRASFEKCQLASEWLIPTILLIRPPPPPPPHTHTHTPPHVFNVGKNISTSQANSNHYGSKAQTRRGGGGGGGKNRKSTVARVLIEEASQVYKRRDVCIQVKKRIKPTHRERCVYSAEEANEAYTQRDVCIQVNKQLKTTHTEMCVFR